MERQHYYACQRMHFSSTHTSGRGSTLGPCTEAGPIQPGWWFRWGMITAHKPCPLSWTEIPWIPLPLDPHSLPSTMATYNIPPTLEELNQKPLSNHGYHLGQTPGPDQCPTQRIRLMTGSGCKWDEQKDTLIGGRSSNFFTGTIQDMTSAMLAP